MSNIVDKQVCEESTTPVPLLRVTDKDGNELLCVQAGGKLLIGRNERDEFEQEYAERSGVTVEWLHVHNQYGAPCDCEEPGCKGWQMKHIDKNISC